MVSYIKKKLIYWGYVVYVAFGRERGAQCCSASTCCESFKNNPKWENISTLIDFLAVNFSFFAQRIHTTSTSDLRFIAVQPATLISLPMPDDSKIGSLEYGQHDCMIASDQPPFN